MIGMQPTTKPIADTTAMRLQGGWRARWRQRVDLLAALLIAFALLGASTIDSVTQTRYSIDGKVAHWNWDLVAWEIDAIGQKLDEQVRQPAAGLTPDAQTALVVGYLDRARTIGELEAQVEQIYSAATDVGAGDGADVGAGDGVDDGAELQQQLERLRTTQEAERPAAESILEAQVGAALLDAGLSWLGSPLPPVWFTFTEPPIKLVVSPRGRITTAHYAMLEPGVAVAEREQIEQAILQVDNLSAYATTIGGLGAYPTMVIDRAPLAWVLSTVAHEWVHNYLTLFPLGLNYSTSSDLTIMNETVADIVGDEIGRLVLEQHYPETAQALAAREAAVAGGEETPPAFDFRKEMRHTREIVDQFLALGRIKDAEEYMEIRRLLFVENGYAIRKLNQAYFAFHGSYGTGAAATSPLGPKLEELRSLTPDVRTFLETVRGFTAPDALDRALAEWRE